MCIAFNESFRRSVVKYKVTKLFNYTQSSKSNVNDSLNSDRQTFDCILIPQKSLNFGSHLLSFHLPQLLLSQIIM